MSAQGKMASLNHAAREALPHMRKAAADNPNATVMVRVLQFSTGASWVVGEPTPLQYFRWPELSAVSGGRTDLGAALSLLARELRPGSMPDRALPPVLVLCTDGLPTDSYTEGLDMLLSEQWGAKAVRMAFAIGRDVNLEVLGRFIANPEIRPLTAHNPDDLVRYLRWASTSVLQAASTANPEAASLRPPPVPVEIYQDATW
jgi:uncharacterized protein YegL